MANAIILQDFQSGKGPITTLSAGLSDRSLTGTGGSNTRGSAKQILPPGVVPPTAKGLFFELRRYAAVSRPGLRDRRPLEAAGPGSGRSDPRECCIWPPTV